MIPDIVEYKKWVYEEYFFIRAGYMHWVHLHWVTWVIEFESQLKISIWKSKHHTQSIWNSYLDFLEPHWAVRRKWGKVF